MANVNNDAAFIYRKLLKQGRNTYKVVLLLNLALFSIENSN